MKTYEMLIDGAFVKAASGKTFEVRNPATDEVMAHVPDASAADVDRAVTAARRAFEGGWRDVTAQERGRILLRLAEKMRAELPRLAEIETLNSGKPIVESEYDLTDVATCFEYYGGLATKLHGEVLPVPDNAISMALREPLGVAGQIIPWNYPLLMAAWKIAPALCAGCTTVIKPAEQTSPWLMKRPNSAPSTLASKSASANKMFGDLPPSSSEIFFRVSAAERMMSRPTSRLPVKAILSTSSWATMAAPVWPKPVTTLTTPLGTPHSSKKRANSRSVRGVCSAGLITMEQPAHSAGASFQAAISNG